MAADTPGPDPKPSSTKDNFLPEPIEEDVDGVEVESSHSAETSLADQAASSTVEDDNAVHRFHEVSTRLEERMASCSSLPRPISRNKSITRSLVPRMRRMFEKSRSCDPELGVTAPNRVPDHPRRYLTADTVGVGRDGTESTTSSFILLDSGLRSGSSLTLAELERFGGDRRQGTHDQGDMARRASGELADRKHRGGFVNKCVTKVKSFIGNKSEERE